VDTCFRTKEILKVEKKTTKKERGVTVLWQIHKDQSFRLGLVNAKLQYFFVIHVHMKKQAVQPLACLNELGNKISLLFVCIGHMSG